MDELIDIVTRDGQLTGSSALKSEIHRLGHYHNTVHVWLYSNDGKVLLQQRAATKAIKPLLWDVSVAGHIDAGESLEEGAVREAAEEIGIAIDPNDLKKIGVFECFQSYDNGMVDNEFHHTFITKLTVRFEELVPQEEEVEALKLVTIQEFENKLSNSENNNHFVASNRAYYLKVLQAINNEITS